MARQSCPAVKSRTRDPASRCAVRVTEASGGADDDANLPACRDSHAADGRRDPWPDGPSSEGQHSHHRQRPESEEHTSELQSQSNLVCRLLLEKKKRASTRPAVTTVRMV